MNPRLIKNPVVFTLAGVALIVVLYLAVVPRAVAYFMTADMRRDYAAQSALFSASLTSLGIPSPERTVYECLDGLDTHLRSQMFCENFNAYKYQFTAPEASIVASLPSTTTAFDILLKANGWTTDRPGDRVTTLAGSNPYIASNGGTGGDVPFHKNIGAVSCNLKISFSSPANTVSPGAINVTQFSCQKHVSFVLPRITIPKPEGI